MSKPSLIDEDQRLEEDLIQTFEAGYKQHGLDYPKSYSDMQAGVRAVLRMFSVVRRPLAVPLRIKCHVCDGKKSFITLNECSADGSASDITRKYCPICKGKGYVDG